MTHSLPSSPAPSSLESYSCLVGGSAAMQGARAQLRRISVHFRVLLLTGEPGTGKEIVARTLHSLSRQPESQFIAHSAASFLSMLPELPPEGADLRAPCTLYFGDVSALKPTEQIYLLQWLKRSPAPRSGVQRPRMIFATEHDLRFLTGSGRFDPELYEHIASVEMLLPPLRSRVEDIREVAAHLLAADPPGSQLACLIDRRALGRLESYRWPGNVRELERVVDLARLHARGGVIEAMHLPPLDGLFPTPHRPRVPGDAEKLEEVIRHHVLEVLSHSSGNKVRAAERLGISRSTLYRMLEQDVPAMRLDPTG